MYCKNCGKEMVDDARFCSACGCYVDPAAKGEINGVDNRHLDFREKDEGMDVATVVLAILGFIIPLVGIIGAIAQLIAGKNKSAGVIGLVTFIGFIFWLMFWGY